jgi:hypothetical protein
VAGLLIFGLLFAYVALFYYMAKHVPTRALKIAAIVVGLAIPFWDLPISYLSYRRQCDEHGGLNILGQPPKTESILLDPGVGYESTRLFAKYGFTKIEYVTPSGIVSFTKTKDGIQKSTQAKPTSAFKISRNYGERAGWNATRRDLTLSRVDDGKVVARHSEFFWHGMWWQITIGTGGREIVAHCHGGAEEELLRFAFGAIR